MYENNGYKAVSGLVTERVSRDDQTPSTKISWCQKIRKKHSFPVMHNNHGKIQ